MLNSSIFTSKYRKFQTIYAVFVNTAYIIHARNVYAEHVPEGEYGDLPSQRVNPFTPEKIKKNTRRTDKGFGVSSKAGLTDYRQSFFFGGEG